jgi:glycosyltransferase involved in cell wall biosynthesis
MIAPQPFFRARGTPFSVLQRIHALIKLGHVVELVTYPMGEAVELEGLTIHRARRVPFVHDVRIGPSPAKILLDAALLLKAMELLQTQSYDLIHTHEEAGVLGAWLSRRHGLRHLHEMHSSLPEQFGNFGRYNWWPVVTLFRALERFTLRRSDAVITICPALDEHVTREGYALPSAMIENVYELATAAVEPHETEQLRTGLGLSRRMTVVYTGTLEPYQGIDLLLQSVPRVRATVPEVHFLIVGGTEEQSAAIRRRAAELGLGDAVTCLPAVTPEQVPAYHSLADVLVTCRTRGTNTPLKIYEYLRAARPLVATAISSHEQVLDGDCAELVDATPEGVAAGLSRVLTDPVRAATLARNARSYSERRYSSEQYVARLSGLLAQLAPAIANGHQAEAPGAVRAYRIIDDSAAEAASGVTEPTAPSSVRR